MNEYGKWNSSTFDEMRMRTSAHRIVAVHVRGLQLKGRHLKLILKLVLVLRERG